MQSAGVISGDEDDEEAIRSAKRRRNYGCTPYRSGVIKARESRLGEAHCRGEVQSGKQPNQGM